MNGAITFSCRPRISCAIWLGLSFILCLTITACSRSAWVKKDGHEVAPSEQLECANEVGSAPENRALGHDELQPKIEECMKAKGYHRRPWWLLNDLHWNISPPS